MPHFAVAQEDEHEFLFEVCPKESGQCDHAYTGYADKYHRRYEFLKPRDTKGKSVDDLIKEVRAIEAQKYPPQVKPTGHAQPLEIEGKSL